ncbi:ribosomal protein S18-alanine N-acetyltransferase [Thalassobacillus hwangdonensis]|uniref:[Ribosomal protein bS18]-alanine N-acetyltransferase n=1 Tax=Thalassobacillus hwangdonensis TaxID=546108 RepID=A0ABW3L7E3_9BACI
MGRSEMDTAIVRKMTQADLEAVMEVEHSSFTVPWTKETFVNEMEINRYAHYFVIEKDQNVVGYCGLWVIIDEAHITNIAILPEYRGKEYGSFLLEHVIQYARDMGAIQISLEVRVSNMAAQRMYRRFGMVPGGVRKNYYTDDGEDALVMWVKL